MAINLIRIKIENKHKYAGTLYLGFPGGSDGKESAWNAGDPG